MNGLLAGLITKLAGLGTLAKAAIATATAALTLTVAGGATGVLPIPGATSGAPAVVQSAIPRAATAGVGASGSVTPTVTAGAGAQAPAGAATATAPTTASAGATGSIGGVLPAATGATTGAVPTPKVSTSAGSTSPTLPTLANLPPCVKALIPAKGTIPEPATFVPQLVACVQSLIAAHLPTGDVPGLLGSANLPANITSCLTSVFGSMAGGAGVGTPQAALAKVVAACGPMGSMGSIPGLGSLPGKAGALPSHTTGK